MKGSGVQAHQRRGLLFLLSYALSIIKLLLLLKVYVTLIYKHIQLEYTQCTQNANYIYPTSLIIIIALDPLGHHAASCRHGGDVVARHNHLRDIVANFCRRAHLSVRVEVGYGLARDHVNSRPADVLVQGWERGKPAAFDVTVASPLTPVTLNNASTSVGAAAYAAELRKHVANDTRCQELGWTCIPLAVET